MQQSSSMLEGQIAIVTGGANGLGLSIANLLNEAGAIVVVFDRDQDKLNALPTHFKKELVDVTRIDEIQKAVDNIIKMNGRIDILINNAGFIYNEPLINITKQERKHDYETYKKVIDVNMNSVFLMTSIVVEQMIIKRTRGVIVNISSISAEGNPGQTAYSAAKAGVNAFTKTWAKELGPLGIRVAAVSPGFIETNSTKNALDVNILNTIIKKIPLKKLGNVMDIAHIVLSIIYNQYINGTVIEVNGGLVL